MKKVPTYREYVDGIMRAIAASYCIPVEKLLRDYNGSTYPTPLYQKIFKWKNIPNEQNQIIGLA